VQILFKVSYFNIYNYGTIGSFQQFLSTYNTVNCNTCPQNFGAGSDPDIFGKLTDIIDNTLGEYQKHQNTDNFIGFYSGEPFAKDARNSRDGGQFMLRVMATDTRTNGIQKIDKMFRETWAGQVQGNYKFDLFTGDQTNTGLWFIECKSTDELPADMGQLSAYFSVIRNISNLEYIFNAKKAGTATQAKEAVQKQLYNGTSLTNMGTNLFNTIWGNTGTNGNNGLRQSLFPINNTEALKGGAMNDFKQMISSLDNNFFKFIMVK